MDGWRTGMLMLGAQLPFQFLQFGPQLLLSGFASVDARDYTILADDARETDWLGRSALR